ncbi:MAG: 3-oxoacyl-[acyl-carrier-protein] synthase III C-terminal domain-containing protein [Casimicrobiaceae bacterium]
MAYIHGLGHFHPANEIDNEFLRNLDIGTDATWIMERVGIESRRTVLSLDYIRTTRNADPRQAIEASLYSNAETGALAARQAIDAAGINTSDIGLVISGSCSPQSSCPAEACTIAAELGIEAPAFDVNSACSSLAAQLHFLDSMRPECLPDFVLLLQVENSTRAIDYNDRNSCVLWGDGSTAQVVSPRLPARLKLVHSQFASDPKNCDKVRFVQAGHFAQDGRTVQAFAIKRSLAVLAQLRQRIDPERVSRTKFIGHQANRGMLDNISRSADIAPENHWFNVDRFGNCGAAGAPSVLSQNQHRLREGDLVSLVVVGGGLSWGGLLIEVSA